MMEFELITTPPTACLRPKLMLSPPTRKDSKKSLTQLLNEDDLLLLNLPLAPPLLGERLHNSCPLSGFTLDDEQSDEEIEEEETSAGFLQLVPCFDQHNLVDDSLAKMAKQGRTKLSVFKRPNKKKQGSWPQFSRNAASSKTTTAAKNSSGSQRIGFTRSPIRRSSSTASCA